jgi:hypothetical protein
MEWAERIKAEAGIAQSGRDDAGMKETRTVVHNHTCECVPCLFTSCFLSGPGRLLSSHPGVLQNARGRTETYLMS